MTIVSIILGVLLILGGCSCLATPVVTFLSTGYYMAILLLILGVSGIVRAVMQKGHVLDLVTGILAVLVGGMSLGRPGSILLFDGMLLYFIACWFIIRGVSNIAMGFAARKVTKGWFWGVLAGVLGIIVGIMSFAHPLITAFTAGLLIGLYFIEAGIDMILIGFTVEKIGDTVEEASDNAE